MFRIIAGEIQQCIEDIRLSEVFLQSNDLALELRDFAAQRSVFFA